MRGEGGRECGIGESAREGDRVNVESAEWGMGNTQGVSESGMSDRAARREPRFDRGAGAERWREKAGGQRAPRAGAVDMRAKMGSHGYADNAMRAVMGEVNQAAAGAGTREALPWR